MSWWDTTKRIGLGVATGGLSEGMGARPVLDAAAGSSDYTKNLLFGGNATKGIDAAPPQYDAATAALGQIASTAQGRAAPTMTAAQLDPTNMNQSRAGLFDTAGRLSAIASGTQAGAGELAVNRQVGQAAASQHSMAMMARGAGSALAGRNAARNTMDIGLGGAGAAAQAQMQDQQAANQQLGSIYGQAYGQDANVAGQNAQLQQGAAQANMGAQLTQTQMNDSRQIQALGQQLGWDQAKINAELAKAGIAATDKGILPGLLQGAAQAGITYATGGIGKGAAPPSAPNPSMYTNNPYGTSDPYPSSGLITMPNQVASDERLKTNIHDGSAAANAATARLGAVMYNYIDPALGAGPQLGVTAQNLEHAGLGHVVADTPGGKVVHGAKLAAANTAQIAALGQQVAQLRAAQAVPADVPFSPGIATAASIPEAVKAERLRRAGMYLGPSSTSYVPGPAGYWYSPSGISGGTQLGDAGGQ